VSVTLRSIRLAEAERDSIALLLVDRDDVQLLAALFVQSMKCSHMRSKLRRRKGVRG
jgi:hypothetical protein